MLGKLILTEKQEKDNRIAHRILKLEALITSGWNRLDSQAQQILETLQDKLEGEQDHDR